MKKSFVFSALLLMAAVGTSSAQIIGMPVWNDPNAGTGVTISGEAGFPNNGVGTTFAARGNMGLGSLQLGATVGTHDPDYSGRISSVGATAGFKIFGGVVVPVAVNAQVGYSTEAADPGSYSRVTTAVGIGVKAPAPGLNLQGWLSPGIRLLRHPNGTGGTDTDSNFGVAVGASLGLGLLGIHAGIDHENTPGNSSETIFGIGVHLGLHAPVGM